MRQIAPEWYRDFHCKAGACRHTCCAGWEIDIDPDTLNAYYQTPGVFGQRLKESIANDECPHFILGEGERCPFLNENNLCDIILTLGEDHLCDICADHPRFRNFLSDRVEIGLGLCCEEAARLALTREEPFALTVLSDDGEGKDGDEYEQELLAQRDRLLALICDRSLSLEARAQRLMKQYCEANEEYSSDTWGILLQSYEQLSSDWTDLLKRLEKEAPPMVLPDSISMEQFLANTLYRHGIAASEDGRWGERVRFCVWAARLLAALSRLDNAPPLTELARLFSSEIEYSDENLEALLDEFHTFNTVENDEYTDN